TAAGGLARLERDVLDRGATVVTVAYGVNDIGWGLKADEEHKRKYLDGIAGIVKRCREKNVRVFICSAAVTGGDPNKSETDFLQTMCDEGMALSRQLGGEAIDVQRAMREIQRRVVKANEQITDAAKKETLHAPDGVHLNALGQTAMAYAILKGLGAPAAVSSVAIDMSQGPITEAAGCRVSELAAQGDHLEFTRLDEGLPLNGETFFALQFRFVPIPDQLNRYLLQVTSLPEGRYDVSADGRSVGTYTADRLGQGVNIASATTDGWLPGGPWDAQANVLHSLTEARDKLNLASLLVNTHLPGQELTQQFLLEATDRNRELEELQRLVSRPRPYRFVVERVNGKQ
ncbi:MAG TPA: GDSL-type esterase/lipase family protein, partial [Planctomycetaceae bacterium]|nr:GDSL-type esterase/lipase family protein [Planctomycetaceae bacterium]